jgi:hypothetical protein
VANPQRLRPARYPFVRDAAAQHESVRSRP